jgi:hypothetical protein
MAAWKYNRPPIAVTGDDQQPFVGQLIPQDGPFVPEDLQALNPDRSKGEGE